MGTPRRKLLPSFSAIRSGQTATCQLTLGQRLRKFTLELSDDGTASSGNGGDIPTVLDNLIGDIRWKTSGITQRIAKGSELNRMNAVNGIQYAARSSGAPGTSAFVVNLTMYFDEPWRKSNAQASAGGVNLVGISSSSIEVDFVAGLTSPNVQGTYEWDLPVDNIGKIMKYYRQSLAAVGTFNDFQLLNGVIKGQLQAMHLQPTSETTPKYVNKVKLTAQGLPIIDQISHLQNQMALLDRDLNPDTSAVPWYDIVLDVDDPITSGLPTDGLTQFELHAEYNAAAAGNILANIIAMGEPD